MNRILLISFFASFFAFNVYHCDVKADAIGDIPVITIMLDVDGNQEFPVDVINRLPDLIYGTNIIPYYHTINDGDFIDTDFVYSVNEVWVKNSFGRSRIVGDSNSVFGPYPIPAPFSCSNSTEVLQNLIDQHPEIPVTILNNPKAIVLFLLSESSSNVICPGYGVANGGQIFHPSLTGGSTMAKIAFSRSIKQRVILHEIAHHFGAGHAGSAQCESLVDLVDIYNMCLISEYGNPTSFMGASVSIEMHGDAITKQNLGWLSFDNNSKQQIVRVTENSVINLGSISDETHVGVKAISIPHAQEQDLVLSFRRTRNLDGSLSLDARYPERYDAYEAINGLELIIGRHAPGGSNQAQPLAAGRLIHATNINEPVGYSGVPMDHTLQFGSSYVDPISLTQIQVGQINSLTNEVEVSITVGRTDFYPPEVEAINFTPSANDPCVGELKISGISDQSGLAAATVRVYRSQYLLETLQIDIDDNYEELQIPIPMSRFGSPDVRIEVLLTDNANTASGAGTISPNNLFVSDSISYPQNVVSLQCDPTGPVITTPFTNNSYQPASGVINVEVTESEGFLFDTIIEVRKVMPDGSLFPVPMAFQWHQNIYESEAVFNLEYPSLGAQNLPEGNYALRIRAKNSNLIETLSTTFFSVTSTASFIRGDVNFDGSVNIADAVTLLGDLFNSNTSVSNCADAQDVNDDGIVNIADAVFLLGVLFTPEITGDIPEPFQNIGQDPTEDSLTCSSGLSQ
jgi:hypothetical protein